MQRQFDVMDLVPAKVPPRVVDAAEVAMWLAQGRTDRWICEEYERRYNMVTPPELWANMRRGIVPPAAPPPERQLVPWEVGPEHRWAYQLVMLRLEARRRSGDHLTGAELRGLRAWARRLAERDLVVHYEPTSHEGFSYVPRRPGLDTDLIRDPRVA